MFATFIDNKIMSQWEEKEPLLRVFDARIDKARLYNVRAPSLRSSNYQRCSILKESGKPRSRGMSARVCLRWGCRLPGRLVNLLVFSGSIAAAPVVFLMRQDNWNIFPSSQISAWSWPFQERQKLSVKFVRLACACVIHWQPWGGADLKSPRC